MSIQNTYSTAFISTGIPGLDNVLGGGLTRDRLYLVEGDPGAGKTTLALQYLAEGAARGETVLYITLAETEVELRAVAQAMARELGPQNIHVGHLIIDSGVDTEWVRQRRIEALGPDALKDPDALMPPASVADAYWRLYEQPRSAWTFEMEIRPFKETW